MPRRRPAAHIEELRVALQSISMRGRAAVLNRLACKITVVATPHGHPVLLRALDVAMISGILGPVSALQRASQSPPLRARRRERLTADVECAADSLQPGESR